MKLSILFISIIFLSIGCSTDYCPDYSDGFAIAQFNGEDWKAESSAAIYIAHSTNEVFDLGFEIYNNNGILRKSLGIVNIPLMISRHTDFRPKGSVQDNRISCSYHRLISDGDAVSEQYILIQEEDNYIEISSLDRLSGIIKGTFNLSFELDTSIGKYHESAPDFAIFKNGEFEVTLEE